MDKYILGYDLIVSNGIECGQKGYKALFSKIDTLESLNIDYSNNLKAISYTDDLYDKLIDIMNNDMKLVKQVAKALFIKGYITFDNIDNAELTIMVLSTVEDNCMNVYKINNRYYYERGFNSWELSKEWVK